MGQRGGLRVLIWNESGWITAFIGGGGGSGCLVVSTLKEQSEFYP